MIRICIGGDISFSKIEELSWGKRISEYLGSHDLVLANLEAPLTHSTKKKALESYYLKADPDTVKWLYPFDAMSLANNHIFDYKEKGLIDTRKILDANDIKYFGAGLKKAEAYEALCYEINGIKIAFLGATHFYRFKCTRKYGTADIYSKRFMNAIQKYKKEGYFVVVLPHWGYEHQPYPSPKDRKTAKRMINSGADLIAGSHSHEIQAYEKIDNKYVFYSLGNFLFSEKDFVMKSRKLSESLLVSIEIKCDHSYVVNTDTCYFDQTAIELSSTDDDNRVKTYIERISSQLEASSNRYSKLFYDDFTKVNKQRVSNRSNKNNSRSKKGSIKSILNKILYYVVLINMLDSQWIKNMLYMRFPFSRKHIIRITSF